MTKNKSSMMANFKYCALRVFGPNRVRTVPDKPTTIAIGTVIKSVLIMAPLPPCRPDLETLALIAYRIASMMPLGGAIGDLLRTPFGRASENKPSTHLDE